MHANTEILLDSLTKMALDPNMTRQEVFTLTQAAMTIRMLQMKVGDLELEMAFMVAGKDAPSKSPDSEIIGADKGVILSNPPIPKKSQNVKKPKKVPDYNNPPKTTPK